MELNFLQWLQTLHNPILDKIMLFFTAIGEIGLIWIVIAIVFLCIKKYRICGFAMLAALLLGFLTANIFLKNVIARQRPCWIDPSVTLLVTSPKDYSFPSGHTVSSFAAAMTIFLYHKKMGIAALIMALLISFSRLYLYVHYPSDVLVGFLIGILMALLAKRGLGYILTPHPKKN